MAKKDFTANYNGEAIKPGEVMIPFEYTDLDAEICINPECVKTLTVGGRKFKVIYKAVPEQWAKVGTSALNLVQNETLGHYDIPGGVSMDEMMDEYELALAAEPSAEEQMITADGFRDNMDMFVTLMNKLIEKSPKIGYAVLLIFSGSKGQDFADKLHLKHDGANKVRREASELLTLGLINMDLNTVSCRRNDHTEEYRKEAYALLEQILKAM